MTWYIDRFISEGFTILSGSTGTGKTVAALNILDGIANGVALKALLAKKS